MDAGRIRRGVARRIRKVVDPHGANIEFSQKQTEKRSVRRRAGIRSQGYDEMVRETGLTAEALSAKLDRLRALDVTTIPFTRFKGYGLYKMSDEEAAETLRLMKKEADLAYDLMWDLRLVDQEKLTYEEMEPKIRDYMTLKSRLMTDEYKRETASCAGYLHPEMMSDEEIDELATDIEFTRNVLRYKPGNYVAFHFYGKSLAERREFINVRERSMLLPMLNSEESMAILNDKLLTYEKFHEFFGREIEKISKRTDYRKFSRFLDRNPKAVVKPRFDSSGAGIRLIRSDEVSDRKALFRELLKKYKFFILEGFIDAADEIRALNPDSVNTVRVITYNDGNNISVRSSSIRIGHAGSFVDNAGAGGITAYVDSETGVICTEGVDEQGFRYDKHPDHGYTIKGYQIPAWDKALEMVDAMAAMIPESKYIGWDITCNTDYEWVLVEGNAQTGFIGAQAPLGIGRRAEFLNTIGADPKGVISDMMPLTHAETVEKKTGIPVDKTMEHLRHCEKLGLDGRYYTSFRAWELSDDEITALAIEIDKRNNRIREIEDDLIWRTAAKSGLDTETVRERFRLAKLFGYENWWFVQDGIYLLSNDEIIRQKNIRTREYDNKLKGSQSSRLGELRKEICREKDWNRAQYNLEFFRARNIYGCGRDEFAIYRMSDMDPETAGSILTAEVKHQAWLRNITDFDNSLIMKSKVRFSETFSDLMNRVCFPSKGISYDEFLEKIEGLDRIVYKPEEGEKGIGMEILSVNNSEDQNREAYDHLNKLAPGIIEEFIIQDDEIAGLYPDAVNTLRVITAVRDGRADVIMAAIRTGTSGNVDNWSQGGISAGIDVRTGAVVTDGGDNYGRRYNRHPVSGRTFRGFVIPHWSDVEACCCAAAERCRDMPFVGWDAAVLADGRVALIEGNLAFGTKAIQTPFTFDGQGLRPALEECLRD